MSCCKDQMWGEFCEMIDIECGEYYFNNFGRMPTEEEQQEFFEEYMEGDIRRGEE